MFDWNVFGGPVIPPQGVFGCVGNGCFSWMIPNLYEWEMVGLPNNPSGQITMFTTITKTG